MSEIDYYLDERNSYQRLEDEYKKYGKLIICVDYDDTLYDYHKLGRTYNDIINLLHRWENHSEVIIFTGNGTEEYPRMKRYLENIGIKYKGINEDSSVPVSGRKVYANVYIDDRGGLAQVYKELITLISKIENGEVKCTNLTQKKQKMEQLSGSESGSRKMEKTAQQS